MQKGTKNKSGFSAIEMMVSVLIFSLVMVATMSIFIKMTDAQKRSKAVQRNMEDVKFAMEDMAKTIRTSNIISCDNSEADDCSGLSLSIETYDYSQSKCIQYKIVDNKIVSREVAGEEDNCVFSGDFNDMAGNNNKIESGGFLVTKSSSGTLVGKVTILSEICWEYQNETCSSAKSDNVLMQTTVSLRN